MSRIPRFDSGNLLTELRTLAAIVARHDRSEIETVNPPLERHGRTLTIQGAASVNSAAKTLRIAKILGHVADPATSGAPWHYGWQDTINADTVGSFNLTINANGATGTYVGANGQLFRTAGTGDPATSSWANDDWQLVLNTDGYYTIVGITDDPDIPAGPCWIATAAANAIGPFPPSGGGAEGTITTSRDPQTDGLHDNFEDRYPTAGYLATNTYVLMAMNPATSRWECEAYDVPAVTPSLYRTPDTGAGCFEGSFAWPTGVVRMVVDFVGGGAGGETGVVSVGGIGGGAALAQRVTLLHVPGQDTVTVSRGAQVGASTAGNDTTVTYNSIVYTSTGGLRAHGSITGSDAGGDGRNSAFGIGGQGGLGAWGGPTVGSNGTGYGSGGGGGGSSGAGAQAGGSGMAGCAWAEYVLLE